MTGMGDFDIFYANCIDLVAKINDANNIATGAASIMDSVNCISTSSQTVMSPTSTVILSYFNTADTSYRKIDTDNATIRGKRFIEDTWPKIQAEYIRCKQNNSCVFPKYNMQKTYSDITALYASISDAWNKILVTLNNFYNFVYNAIKQSKPPANLLELDKCISGFIAYINAQCDAAIKSITDYSNYATNINDSAKVLVEEITYTYGQIQRINYQYADANTDITSAITNATSIKSINDDIQKSINPILAGYAKVKSATNFSDIIAIYNANKLIAANLLAASVGKKLQLAERYESIRRLGDAIKRILRPNALPPDKLTYDAIDKYHVNQLGILGDQFAPGRININKEIANYKTARELDYIQHDINTVQSNLNTLAGHNHRDLSAGDVRAFKNAANSHIINVQPVASGGGGTASFYLLFANSGCLESSISSTGTSLAPAICNSTRESQLFAYDHYSHALSPKGAHNASSASAVPSTHCLAFNQTGEAALVKCIAGDKQQLFAPINHYVRI
jgi:hypothetical protein